MTTHQRTIQGASRALASVALATLAVAATAGEITLFSQRDFAGNAMTVRGAAPSLDRIGFDDTAGSIAVREGVWEVCTERQFRGRCAQLQPGEYSSFGVSVNDRIASARELAPAAPARTAALVPKPAAPSAVAPLPAPTVAPAAAEPLVIAPSTPLPAGAARIVLYEDTSLRGRSLELNGTNVDLDTVRFGDRADSAIVTGGTWRLCDSAGGRGDCVEVMPGRYDSLGALTNRIQSAELLSANPTAPIARVGARVVLYQYPDFRGHSIVIDRPDLPGLTAEFVNGGAGSMRIEAGRWMFCSSAEYAGQCRTFEPGDYARLPHELDRIASGRLVADRYSSLAPSTP